MKNNIDSRTVFTDALETLGTIIGENEKRDAVHLAVEPVICGNHSLSPGDRIKIGKDGKAYLSGYGSAIGIVDPFLTDEVYEGQRFWLIVMPRQITSLRHVWTHPAFDDVKDDIAIESAAQKRVSEKWMQEFADDLGVSYSRLIEQAKHYGGQKERDGWDFWSHPEFEGHYICDEFWEHFENITGVKPVNTANFLTCSC
jgi:hypothetical protein